MIETATDSEEVSRVIDTVSARSKQLYEKAYNRITVLAGEQKTEKTDTVQSTDGVTEKNAAERKNREFLGNMENAVGEATREISDLIVSVGAELENFAKSEEVKNAVDKTKEGVIDVAEKAVDILKSWLKPDGE